MRSSDEGLPKGVLAHLKGLITSSGLPDTDVTLEALSRAWAGKKRLFERQVRALDMQAVRSLAPDDPRGALLLTWSGSLVSLGPAEGAGRHVEYASIELRTDVPHLARVEHGGPEGVLSVDEPATFRGGPIHITSPLLQIAVCGPEVPPGEQVRRIREATVFLTNGFAKINRTIALPAAGMPERFTRKSIVAWVASRNNLSQKQARRVIDDYLTILESGMLLGQRIPVGALGRLSLRKRPARQARVGINPATGIEITLPARPEEAVPRMRFSRLVKDRARQVRLQPLGPGVS